jgi:hypothetical protein
MKLTRRQKEFIRSLQELNQRVDGPIHYSTLAEHLGVSPFTAYDMLCLLEEKGMVTSEYRLPDEHSGPGRAERLFYPSEKALQKKEMLKAEARRLNLDEAGIRKLMMERIQQGELPQLKLAEQVLERIPPENGSAELRYCMEVMTVIALRMRECPVGKESQLFISGILNDGGSNHSQQLNLLSGFATGLLARECRSDLEWMQILLEHVTGFQKALGKLDQDETSRLWQYTQSVFPGREIQAEKNTVIEPAPSL